MKTKDCKTGIIAAIQKVISDHSKVFSNLSYLSILQLFLLLGPLITYPYLVKVLGMELYGIVLTAQMLANYATLIVDFGTSTVCAKHISINRSDSSKLSEIVSSILCVRSFLFAVCFAFYILIVFLVPTYREYLLLFLFSYMLVLYDVLYPQYFFQGIEEMRTITIISITTRLIFILLVFVVVNSKDDYLLVPILYAIGYTIGGVVALYIIFAKKKLKFYKPKINEMKVYIKDSIPIFATGIICSVKDKFNYMLLGTSVGMDSVVVYDLSLKVNSLLNKPQELLNTVMLPRIAKSRSVLQVKKLIMTSFVLVMSLFLVVNFLLPEIVDFFLHKEIDMMPIRLMTIAPVILSISICIYYNVFVAFGYNRYALYSIMVTTSAYLIALVIMLFTHHLNTLYSFVYLAIIGYFTELLYRIFAARKLMLKYKENN